MNLLKMPKQAAKILFVFVLLIFIIPGVTALSSEDGAGGPQVRLQYASFDPLQGEPYVPEEARYQVAAVDVSTYLLQFSGPVRQEWKAGVQATGAKLYGYVPDYTFTARMDGATLQQVSALPYVRWVGLYHPAYRTSNALKASLATPETQPVDLLVESLPDADMIALEAQVQSLGGIVHEWTQNDYAGYVRLLLPEDQIDALAALDGVLWVEPYLEPQLLNDIATGTIMHASTVHYTLGLSGADQVVAVADSGLDTGDEATLHPDVKGRLIKAYALGRTDDWSDYISHGTHVVGSVLGDGTVSGGKYTGGAPKAQLVLQSVGDALGGITGIPSTNIDSLIYQAHSDGARIHSNSWGAAYEGAYTPYSQQVDRAMWERKDMLVLFSAGNAGVDADRDGLIDEDSINSPGTAKNILTVGASENYRPSIPYLWGFSYASPIASDLIADNPSGMAAFSSRGPTNDGRIKPDVVAPGTYIASLRTRQYIFDDNLEDGVTGYTTATVNGGTGSSPWQLRTDEPHSARHYWKETINDVFPAGAMTVLLTPPWDVRPAGGFFDVHFWHKYSLSEADSLIVLVINSATNEIIDLEELTESNSNGNYTLRTVKFSPIYIPSSVRIGFAIQSGGGTSNSSWQIDDIRVDGSDWGTMSSVDLANPGDVIDEAYQMMGGTSMSTPLTAGSAALVREWLVERRGIANPSAALLKAVLINGAANLSPGQYTSPQEVPTQRPNNVTGWGRVNLLTSLSPPLPRQVWLQDNTSGLATGVSATYTLTVGSSVTADQATAYTAVPGPPTTPPTLISQMTAETNLIPIENITPDAGVSLAGLEQLIQNGGFESEGAWMTSDMARTMAQAFGGSWSMGSIAGVNGHFSQAVSIPTETTSAILDFYWKNENPDMDGETCFDTQHIEIWDESFSNQIGVAPQYCATDSSWYHLTLSFDPILDYVRGNTVNIRFVIEQNDADPKTVFYFDDVALNVSTSDSPPTEAGSLRITLAWTDTPGEPYSAKTLVNDLDLEVIAPDGTTRYYGNTGLYNGGQCLRDEKWDACNNVEGVMIPEATSGTYQVIVHGINVPDGPQPFALVAVGNNLLGTASNLKAIFLPMIIH